MDSINKLDSELFKGRVIDSIDNKTVNYLVINFTDGSYIEIETAYMGNGIYGIEGRFTEREMD